MIYIRFISHYTNRIKVHFFSVGYGYEVKYSTYIYENIVNDVPRNSITPETNKKV